MFGSDGVQPARSATVKHGGGSVMIRGCVSEKHVGEMTFTDISEPDVKCARAYPSCHMLKGGVYNIIKDKGYMLPIT